MDKSYEFDNITVTKFFVAFTASTIDLTFATSKYIDYALYICTVYAQYICIMQEISPVEHNSIHKNCNSIQFSLLFDKVIQ